MSQMSNLPYRLSSNDFIFAVRLGRDDEAPDKIETFQAINTGFELAVPTAQRSPRSLDAN
ncbi:hypothetical protein [Rhizobium leguminosarum]|uniref:hypothetical protein n=1 Tax=Rhizobium leguminosarum TaxID=384 RepID=UPI0011AE9441|nr:hypothetical protein [Rhizobium leguminosarum]